MRVEFEHRQFERPPQPGELPPSGLQVTLGDRRVPEPLARQLAGRIRVTRWLVLMAGAAGVAFATQRAGVSLSGALCIFAGALPALWVMGWLSGALLHLRRTARQLDEVGSTKWQAQVEAATRRSKVSFELLDTGLQVTREGAAPALVGYPRVGMQRLGPEVLVVNVEGEAFQVPCAAFATADDFDAFCLALQGHVWRAERNAGRSL